MRLVPGDLPVMPGKAKHQFSCQSKTACVMFVTFDRNLRHLLGER